MSHQPPADTKCDLGRHRERLTGISNTQSKLRRQTRCKRGHGGDVHEAQSRLKWVMFPALGQELNSFRPEETERANASHLRPNQTSARKTNPLHVTEQTEIPRVQEV